MALGDPRKCRPSQLSSSTLGDCDIFVNINYVNIVFIFVDSKRGANGITTP